MSKVMADINPSAVVLTVNPRLADAYIEISLGRDMNRDITVHTGPVRNILG